MQFVGERRALPQLIDGKITRRREEHRDGTQRIFEEIANVLDGFFLGLFLGLRDISDDLERKLLRPDVVADFRSLPFPDESFHLVVFDPPHLKELGGKSVMAQSYGVLFSTWETDIRDGWLECMRVLKPNGTLIFKWNEFQITLNQVLAVIPGSPLFGHTSGKHGRTKWMAFIK